MMAHKKERIARLALFVAGSLAVEPVAALDANDVFDQFFRYADNANREFFGGLPEESVDPFSGALHIVQTDLVLPGKAGLDLHIVRSYNSRIWNRTDDPSLASLITEAERSVLGYGWIFHMGRVRNPNATGQPTSPCSADYPLVELPDGSVRVFYRSTSDSKVFVSRDYWRMEPNCPAMGGGGKGTCVWSPTGVRYEFSPANAYFYGAGSPFTATVPVWPVSRIVDRFGNQITVSYVASSNGAVSEIVDSYDRLIEFSYTSGNDGLRLSTMTVNSKVYNYLYTAYATIGGGSMSPRRFLTEVKPPDGPSFQYAYAMTAAVTTNQYALSAMTYPHGGSVNYVYKSANFYYGFSGLMVPFAVVSTKEIKNRGGGSLGTWSYAYTALSSGFNTTTITRPDGKADVYTMYGFGNSSAGSLWKVGLTQKISRGSETEVETQDWGEGPSVSNSVYSAPAYTVCAGAQPPVDNKVVVPRMTKRSIARGGRNYTTSFGDYDAYGQPRMVKETGEQTRTTVWSYVYAPTADDGSTLNLVHGLPASQNVCINGTGECYDNSWTYRGTHKTRDSQTLTGVTTKFDYHVDGNLSAVTNARGQKLRLESYSYGLPTRLDFNGAFTVTQTPYLEGWLKSRTDGRGNTTRYTYDGIGRITLLAPQIGPNTSYSYSADGSSVSQTRGRYTQATTLDGLGRPTVTVDSENVQTNIRYDSMGRTSFKSYPYLKGGVEVGDKFDYDPLNRITTRTKAYRPSSNTCDATGACQVTYAYSQNCITAKEERASGDAVTTKHCSASFGDPGETRLTQVTDGNSKIWSYTYNAYGKLKNVAAPLSQANRTYTFDTVKQFLLTETSGESGKTSYDPNELGQPQSRTDARGYVTNFNYDDPLSRLRTIRYLNGSADDVTQDYDRANNLESVASSNGGTMVYGYDDINRITSETWTYGGKTYTTSYSYDQYGCMYSMKYPTGLTLDISCDTANRIKSIAVGGTISVENVSYHPSGQVAKMTYGDSKSTLTTLAYDDRARLKTATANVSGVLGLSYTYDGADNVRTFENSAIANSSRTMTYDKVNRLLTATAPYLWGTAVYDYDAVGNRKLKSVGSYTSNYVYDSKNRLDAATVATENIKSMTFIWDKAGRLASSSDGTTYFYDGLGRRVRKNVGSEAVLYHYDATGKIISETLPDGSKLRDYIYLGNKLIAVDGCMEGVNSSGCNERQWYHTDTLGSVLARTDVNGAVVAQFDYQPWGEQWTAAGVQGDRQYNGRVYDSGTGFHDYGARMYWPEIGRFISVDSAGPNPANPLSFNRYSYVQNNPYKYTDPDGRNPLLVVGAACAAAGFVGSMVGSYIDTGEVNWNAASQWAAKGFLIGVTAGLGATMLAESEATTTAAEIATTAGPGTVALAKQAEPALSQAGQALMRAEPVGSALKGDVYHRPATFMREIAARTGTHFEITGGDGAKRTLTQVLGKLNDIAGRYEYIVDEAGKLTHQMFVEGGTISGVPIKP